jgi:hypothetical protein
MKSAFICTLFVVTATFLTSCKKADKPVYSGTMTIDNVLTLGGNGAYFGYGFHVPSGKKVSTLENPLDLMTVLEDHDINYNVRKIYFTCSNLAKNAFSRYGDYPDAASAQQAFNELSTFSDAVWTELADPVIKNQIWLFRTNDDKYAKIRVINTFTEKRDDMVFPYAECTFEWVFQPDGTQTFPGK